MRIVCINRDDRPERRRHILSQDWGQRVEFSDAIKAEGLGQCVVEACCRSHLAVLNNHFSIYPDEPILILEDDAQIVDVTSFRKEMREPKMGCTSLGSRIVGNEFVHTHAMLVTGMTKIQMDEFSASIGSRNAEHCYVSAFEEVYQLQPIAVDFWPFHSDRGGRIQSPILSGCRVETPVDVPWNLVSPTHIPQAYRSPNLGDDIQTLSAMEVWKVDKTVDRDDPASWPAGAVVPLVGWWENVPLSESKADVVVISFHCTRQFVTGIHKHRDFLAHAVNRQGFPAMCRDLFTRDILRRMGIPAEFGGCVTLTLTRQKPKRRSGILAVDGRGGDESVSNISKDFPKTPPSVRVQLARERVEQFNRSERIVTKRLHAWLPALALGVESHFLDFHNEPERFDGYNTKAITKGELYEIH